MWNPFGFLWNKPTLKVKDGVNVVKSQKKEEKWSWSELSPGPVSVSLSQWTKPKHCMQHRPRLLHVHIHLHSSQSAVKRFSVVPGESAAPQDWAASLLNSTVHRWFTVVDSSEGVWRVALCHPGEFLWTSLHLSCCCDSASTFSFIRSQIDLTCHSHGDTSACSDFTIKVRVLHSWLHRQFKYFKILQWEELCLFETVPIIIKHEWSCFYFKSSLPWTLFQVLGGS